MNWLLYLCLACTVFDVGVVAGYRKVGVRLTLWDALLVFPGVSVPVAILWFWGNNR